MQSSRPLNSLPRAREIALVEDVSDVLAKIKALGSPEEAFNCYRGHASLNWQITPSLFRQSPRVVRSEYMIVRELISRYPSEFHHDRTMFDRLVRMQHFDLSTRLLDVTSNPLAALYFAVNSLSDEPAAFIIFQVSNSRRKFYDSDSVSCICNLANLQSSEKDVIINTPARIISDFNELYPVARLNQFILEEKTHFQPRIKRDDLFKPLYVVPKLNNPRILAQNGAFLVFGLDSPEQTTSKEIRPYLLRIPASAKRNIREELKSIGIDSRFLFPEIDKAAKQILEDYQ